MKVSIITATYNSAKTLKNTLDSVLKQTYQNYEHIIIDGLSKDETLQIVKEYEPKYEGKLRYISEKDTGLYDAMNKGIKMATGDIIGILNSDDIYANEFVLEKIVHTFQQTNCDGTYADLLFMDRKTMSIPRRIWKSKKGKWEYGWHPAHPTLYLKKQVYDQIGLFHLKYKIVADYDFMLRIWKNKKIRLEYIEEYMIYMRTGGISTAGLKGYSKNLIEAQQVLKENQMQHPSIVNAFRIGRTIKQFVLAKFSKKNGVNTNGKKVRIYLE